MNVRLSGAGVLAILMLVSPLSASIPELVLAPAARQTTERISELDSYALPVGPFDGAKVPATEIEGRVERRVWRIDGASSTTLQLLDPLRTQLTEAGFDIVFQCKDTRCGGFDFRFGIEVIPAPDMHVDLRDFRFLAATSGADEAVGLLVSRGGAAAYVQIITVSPPQPAPGGAAHPDVRPAASATVPEESLQASGSIARALLDHGHVVLSDLAFDTGAARLDDRPYASLDELAAFLRVHPEHRLALVGHTDNVGPLDQNVALSRERAASVRARLLERHGIAPERVEAEGMGYLAPIASNLTPEGRETNRRVEAILIP